MPDCEDNSKAADLVTKPKDRTPTVHSNMYAGILQPESRNKVDRGGLACVEPNGPPPSAPNITQHHDLENLDQQPLATNWDSEPGAVPWPIKQWELDNPHIDSSIWNEWRFREGDIVIDTYIKAGTTWVQQVVGQLIFQGAPDVPVATISPWLDFKFYPREEMLGDMEAQTHRRFVKTHLPIEALVISPKAKYIYVARDGRDIVWSFHNHFKHLKPEVIAAMGGSGAEGEEGEGGAAEGQGGSGGSGKGPQIATPETVEMQDVRQFFLEWLHTDGYPLWPFFSHVAGWWAHRGLPNILLVHFNDLKRDLRGEIQRIADFLDIPVPASAWPAILEHCSLDWMRQHGELTVPDGGYPWVGGADTFLANKGTNGRWHDLLTKDDVAEYEELAELQLGVECAEWLKHGGRVNRPPPPPPPRPRAGPPAAAAAAGIAPGGVAAGQQ